MDKFLARLFLCAASFGAMLGNYWFTFGLWPVSWLSFFFWSTVSTVICFLWLILED